LSINYGNGGIKRGIKFVISSGYAISLGIIAVKPS